MGKFFRTAVLAGMLLVGSLLTSSCGNVYESKLINDAKGSFGISEDKAECLVRRILDQTGWDAEKAWNVLSENNERYFLDSDGERFADAMESGFYACGINPD